MKKLALALVASLALSGGAFAIEPLNQESFAQLKKSVELGNGIRMSYVEMGDPAGEPLILVHGFTDNARSWSLALPYLDQKRRIIAVDMRGHGLTSSPECCYALADFAYDIKLLMDKLNIQRASLVGHSLGSVVSQVVAVNYPERVNKLILVASTNSFAKSNAKDGWLATSVDNLKERPAVDSQFLNDWFQNTLPVDPAFVAIEKSDTSKVELHVWRGVIEQGRITDFGQNLSRIKAPTLLVHGVHDPFFTKENQDVILKEIPDVHYLEFKDAGHNIPWELPQDTAKAIDDFLGRKS